MLNNTSNEAVHINVVLLVISLKANVIQSSEMGFATDQMTVL